MFELILAKAEQPVNDSADSPLLAGNRKNCLQSISHLDRILGRLIRVHRQAQNPLRCPLRDGKTSPLPAALTAQSSKNRLQMQSLGIMHRRRDLSLAQRLLDMGFEDMTPREQRVIERVAKRVAISRDLGEERDKGLTFGDKLADQVASFGGSWTFLISFGLFITAWIAINAVLTMHAFDPYPYILLNLFMSMLASVQDRLPGARILPGSYADVPVAIGVAKGRPDETLGYASRFAALAKANGSVQRVIEQTGLAGIVVAP